jgi:SAM-dependent methyltransferase
MTEASERIIDLYDRHALVFDRARGKSLFERTWLDRFLALLPPGGSILDIGCGVAEPIGRYFIERGYDVTGADSSPAMLALCKRKFPQCTFIQTDMRTLSTARRYDGVIAWNSFFHLDHDHQRRMFPIFRNHATAKAALMFTSGPEHGEAIGVFEGEPLYHASLDSAEYRLLLDQNGFDVVSHVVEDPECNRHTVWLAKTRPTPNDPPPRLTPNSAP